VELHHTTVATLILLHHTFSDFSLAEATSYQSE